MFPGFEVPSLTRCKALTQRVLSNNIVESRVFVAGIAITVGVSIPHIGIWIFWATRNHKALSMKVVKAWFDHPICTVGIP